MNLFRLLSALTVLSIPFTLSGAEQSSAAVAEDCCAVKSTCPVSGKELGSMGEPYVYVHQAEGQPDREVRFCCKGCLPRFKKDPAQYLAKLDQAETRCCGASAAGCCATPENNASAAKKVQKKEAAHPGGRETR